MTETPLSEKKRLIKEARIRSEERRVEKVKADNEKDDKERDSAWASIHRTIINLQSELDHARTHKGGSALHFRCAGNISLLKNTLRADFKALTVILETEQLQSTQNALDTNPQWLEAEPGEVSYMEVMKRTTKTR